MDKIQVLHVITRLDPGGSSTNTIETVSRTLSRLHKEEVISVDGREIVLAWIVCAGLG